MLVVLASSISWWTNIGNHPIYFLFLSQQPDEQLNPKKKVWEKLAVDLKTSSSHSADGSCQAQWQGNPLVITGKGKILEGLQHRGNWN